MAIILPSKDPDAVEPYFVVFCSLDGTNDGSATDDGELQGADISSVTWTIPTGIIKDSQNQDSVTIDAVTYDANTVATIWLSSGTDETDYPLDCKIVTNESPARTLPQTVIIPVREH